MLTFKKFKNGNVAIWDDKAKKFVPMRGQNLVDARKNIHDDYFWDLSRKKLIRAVQIVFKEEGQE